MASRSGTWIVTGTTARAGDHSIITGLRRVAAGRREFGEKFGMAGMPESGAVEHALGNRIGDNRARPSGQDIARPPGEWKRWLPSALVSSGCPGCAVAAWPVATTGRASANASIASSARTSANLTFSPSAVARSCEELEIAEQVECRKLQFIPAQPGLAV